MSQREHLREFRSAVYTADGHAVVSLLGAGTWPGHALQLIGDALLSALTQSIAGAEAFAGRCVVELRERGWDGDEELAAALSAALGTGPVSLFTVTPVDLDQLVDVLEGDPVLGGGYIDLHTGEVWPEAVFESGLDDADEKEDLDVDDRWLYVASEGSQEGFRDMERFTATITEPDLADRLARTLQGRGTFRRFRHELTGWPDLEDRWHAYSAERRRGRARAWLATQGLTPATPTPRAQTETS